MTSQPSNRPGAVLWFTGLSGSGKSTIAEELAKRLAARGLDLEHLDGDRLRSLFPGTGFTREAREEHIKRVGFMASLLEKHGVVVIASLVSPYEATRQFVRGLCRNFCEIYISTPLEECERRDVKGLYARARRGEIPNFTGISDPYEPPRRPELTLDTTAMSLDEACEKILSHLGSRYGY